MLFCLILTTSQWDLYYEFHFTGKETKIKEVKWLAQAHAVGGEVEI